MNIQINCKENVEENDLRYIYYNLKGYIRKYYNYLKHKMREIE